VTDRGTVVALSSRGLVVRTWQDRAVCYDAASGDTLFLDELGTAILELLGPGPVDLEMLISRLEERFAAGQELADVADQALARLRALGLISDTPA